LVPEPCRPPTMMVSRDWWAEMRDRAGQLRVWIARAVIAIVLVAVVTMIAIGVTQLDL